MDAQGQHAFSADHISTGALPRTAAVQALVNEAHERFRSCREGQNSDVYPPLEQIPGDLFGVCLAGVGGDVFAAGDASCEFPIMSVSKPFVFALVCQALGAAATREALGVNATGLPFNSLAAVECDPEGRTNPMVNAGAIAATSLVPGTTAAADSEVIGFNARLAYRRCAAPLDHGRMEWSSERQGSRSNLRVAHSVPAWDWDIAQDRVTWRRGRSSADRPDDPPTWTGPMTSMLELIHPADRATFRNTIDDALRRGGGCEVECRYILGDGGARWITLRGKVLADARDRAGRMIGVYVDTTQRKSDELQATLQHKQLAHLSRVALLAELSGALAHELNQPLATILANARAAQRELQAPAPDLGEVREMLSDIVSDDKRAAEIIRRLRSLFVHGTVEMEIIDVNQSIAEVLELERNDLIAHGITVDVSLAAGAAVRADRIQIQQVLLNLVSNARDSMAAVDSPERRLRIQSVRRDDGSVEIEIGDNGHGIDQVERIFDPFYSTKAGGIGLGLTICRTIMTAHLGRLWATNNAAGGATFHIWLPPARAVWRGSESFGHPR